MEIVAITDAEYMIVGRHGIQGTANGLPIVAAADASDPRRVRGVDNGNGASVRVLVWWAGEPTAL